MKNVRLLSVCSGVCLLAMAALSPALSMAATEAPKVAQSLPLTFEANRGQARAEYGFLFHRDKMEAMFLRNGVDFQLSGLGNGDQIVCLRLLGGDATPIGKKLLEGRTNYLLGADPTRWIRGVPNYEEVEYGDIYPGISLAFYGNNYKFEHDFRVEPGADPSKIVFRLDGAESVALAENGDLGIRTAGGEIAFERPIAYQMESGVRRNVEAAFVLGRDGTVRFRLGRYKASEKLVIDPVLSFSTYLDTQSDFVSAVATDASGNTYITGQTSNATFPVTTGAYGQHCSACANSNWAVFVTKLNATGTAQIYSTFIGGSSYNQPSSLAVDLNGNAIVTGYTGSADFPLKNPISSGTPSNADGFVTSLAPDGASLNFSSRLGGTSSENIDGATYPGGVTTDASGNVYVAGVTESTALPITPGALDEGTPNYNTGDDVFLTKLEQSGNLVYSALLGNTGSASQCCLIAGVAVDSTENAYVVGTVGVTPFTSTTPWPITAGAYQSAMISPGDSAPFAAKVSPDGSKFLYSSLVTTGIASGMALTSSGEVILTGSPNYNFPVTSNAYSSTANTSFFAKLSSDGSQLLYSTYFGGEDNAEFTTTNALALDAQGNIWLAGYTRDSTFPLVYPVSPQFPTSGYGIPATGFLTEFDPTGTHLKFSTYIGDFSGGGLEIALDATGNVHAAGTTATPIYTTPGAFLDAFTAAPAFYEYTYPFAMLINPNEAGASLCLQGSTTPGISFGNLLPQTTTTQSVQVTNCGNAALTISSIVSSNAVFSVPATSNGCTASIAAGSSCTLNVQFAPTAAQIYNGQLTFNSNASIATTSIPVTGTGAYPIASFSPGGGTLLIVFNPLLVGQTSPIFPVWLYNYGLVPLTINMSKIATTGDFAVAPGGSCTATLQGYSSYCSIFVTFTPTAAGTRTGTLSVSSNDPVNPIVTASLTGTAFSTYPVPVITALNSPSYPIASGTTPIAISVGGANFFPVSVVYVNGVSQTTTYVSGSDLTINLAPSMLNAMGEIPITVVNPSPGGGTSAPYPLLVYQAIPLTASALIVDPVGGLLYAAIPSTATQNPNTVIPINPATGALMTPIAVAANPQQLAISSDGSELYVASTGVLQRINLHTLAIERTFDLPVDTQWGQTYVTQMQVVPGSPKSIVVELFAPYVSPAEDGAALFSDSGLVNWIPGVGATTNPLSLYSFAFTSPTTIYGVAQFPGFTELQVSATGISLGSPVSSCCAGDTGAALAWDGTFLYTSSGEVWNPVTQTLLGTYLESNGFPLVEPNVVPDTANGHTYFLDSIDGTAINVYDQANFGLVGTLPFPAIGSFSATDLLRWGSNGFAFLDSNASQIVIATSNLIAPSSNAPIPTVSSVSPSPVYAGGPAFKTQITGTGFTNASIVLINGNSRTTTYVSATSLTAQVLASDIGTAGQFNLNVTTPAPGGGTSYGVPVRIAPALAVTVTPSSSSITTAQALTVVVASNDAPAGSVTLTGGGYTSASTTLSSGSATIIIPAGALAIGTDTLTASFFPSVDGSSYVAALGTASVIVAAPTPAALTSPTPGSQFAGASVTFTWTPGAGVTDYWLNLGTAASGVDAKNIYNSGPITSRTETVSGLPTNGETIYVTLYSEISGVFQPTVYTFHAAGPAVLTAPSPTTKLTASTTFNWTPGTGITHYWLDLGIADAGANAKNIYNSGSTTALTATVTGIPQDGATLYATLYSYIAGAWQPIVYTFTAAGSPVAATLTTPTPGSTLSSSSVNFTWSAGEGVTNYWLNVGTTDSGAGAKNLYTSGSTTLTSVTASGLPTNGEKIYATVYSYISGAWQPTVYTYTASGSPTPAALTTPSPTTQLTSSAVTFTWSPGNPATYYWFNLGTGASGANSKNIYSGSSTTATSVTVSGLPTNGEKIYATLYSYIGGAWQPIVYSYTAE